MLKDSHVFREDAERLFAMPVEDEDFLSGEQVDEMVKSTMAKATESKDIFLALLERWRA